MHLAYKSFQHALILLLGVDRMDREAAVT